MSTGGNGIEYLRFERDSLEGMLTKLRAGIDDVLDALSDVGAEGKGSLNMMYALANIRPVLAWLEVETEAQTKGGAS